MVFAGYVLALPFFSLILSAWGGIWLLVISFRESTTQGLLCLIPCYQLYYVFSRWDDTRVHLLVVWLPDSCRWARRADAGASDWRWSTGRQRSTSERRRTAGSRLQQRSVAGRGTSSTNGDAPGTFTRSWPVPWWTTTRYRPIPFAAPFRGGPPPGTGRIPFPGRPAFPRIQTPDQQLKRIVEGHGDRAVAIVVLGLPRNSDPDKGVTARDVSQAINKQLRELAPEPHGVLVDRWYRQDEDFHGAHRRQARSREANRVRQGRRREADLFEVTVSPDFIASVPRLPAEQQVAVPDIGPSTRSRSRRYPTVPMPSQSH